MTEFTELELSVGKHRFDGKRIFEIAKTLKISENEVLQALNSLRSKTLTVNDSIDFLTKIGRYSGEKVLCNCENQTNQEKK